MHLAFKQVTAFLGNTSLFNLLSLVLSVLGFLLAFFFYFKGVRRRAPMYAVRSIKLVEDSIIGMSGSIEISYFGSKVRNLSVARVALWNSGRETISPDDVAPSSPIKVICSGAAELLGIDIVYEKNAANNFSLSEVKDPNKRNQHLQNELLINFDYFDQNEGVILQIFHTGVEDEIKVVGNVKGCGSIKRVGKPFFHKMSFLSDPFGGLKRKYRRIVVGTLLIITPVLGFMIAIIPMPQTEHKSLIHYVAWFFITALYWSIAISILHRRMPKGFDLFDEDFSSLNERN